jgi:vacuolar protein sorting-associated protein 52
MPPIVPLLTMIRLVEDVIGDVQRRACGPLESFLFGIRLQMWPVFQKAMHENIEAIRKIASSGNIGFFSKGPSTTDASVIDVIFAVGYKTSN